MSKKKLMERKELRAPAVIRLSATYHEETPTTQYDGRTRASSKVEQLRWMKLQQAVTGSLP
jgi:hypothetical protein